MRLRVRWNGEGMMRCMIGEEWGREEEWDLILMGIIVSLRVISYNASFAIR